MNKSILANLIAWLQALSSCFLQEALVNDTDEFRDSTGAVSFFYAPI